MEVDEVVLISGAPHRRGSVTNPEDDRDRSTSTDMKLPVTFRRWQPPRARGGGGRRSRGDRSTWSCRRRPGARGSPAKRGSATPFVRRPPAEGRCETERRRRPKLG